MTGLAIPKKYKFDNCSDEFSERVRIYLSNGYSLSVIRGQYTYGGSEGLFEIALFNKDEISYDDPNDTEGVFCDVIGYLTQDEVKKHLEIAEAIASASVVTA